jgi:serine/threonine-protein kinase
MTKHWFLVDWASCLGAGGEGEVYLARSVTSGELCAVKVSTSLESEVARDQLAQELERWLRAAGDGVVGLVAWNLDVQRPFLVLEFARAGTLADEMAAMRERRQVYHPVRALRRIREVLSALSHVHGRGLVHRDVKPANLLRFGDSIKLTDFGSGRSVVSRRELVTEEFVGTRAYAAPEQLRKSRIDIRSDLYAVGCILHEMLTGSLPTTEAPAPITRSPHLLVLPELDLLLSSLLDPCMENRPRDAADAIRRIDAILDSYTSARRVWKRLGLGQSPY